ncbi:MAG: zinc-binding dehydrogenase [Bacilli bacterium]|nr:zinc-binding dehydrogenase [Bacilli bacterium]MBO6286528.1 zinc-binding dehydrogenase [Bacilli bacterium]
MKAVVFKDITNSDDIALIDIEKPKARKGWPLVKILGFGMNHSELVLRVNEIRADYIDKPIVPGIECVGVIEESLDDGFKTGDKVCSMMGGMGRNYNGSYEEYAILPINKLFHVHSDLDIKHLAAIPETFYTAWGSLFECLKLESKDALLVRGATSALGYASMQIAKALGCRVIGTTHKKEKMHFITDLGCEAILDSEGKIAGKIYANKVLELIGPKTLRDSLRCCYRGGIACNTGILGGEYFLNGFDPIKEIPNGVYLTGFFSNYPTQEAVDSLFKYIDEHNLKPFIGASYKFNDIKLAIKAQEKGIDGKIVVIM